jgi:RNA polymerase sigma-70 factor, ECF subfamily
MSGHELVEPVVDQRAEAAQRTRFEQIWHPSRLRVWRLMARLSGHPDVADDLTQEVSLRAFQAFPTFRGRSSAFTWLYRIAINVAQRYRERERETVAMDDPAVMALPSGEASPEAHAIQSDLRPTLWAALDRLPDDLRTTLILKVYEEMKYREIAETLDIPIGTVKSRLNNAMQRLREELKDVAL